MSLGSPHEYTPTPSPADTRSDTAPIRVLPSASSLPTTMTMIAVQRQWHHHPPTVTISMFLLLSYHHICDTLITPSVIIADSSKLGDRPCTSRRSMPPLSLSVDIHLQPEPTIHGVMISTKPLTTLIDKDDDGGSRSSLAWDT